MRWLVTGAAGMLGRDLVSVLHDNGADVVAFPHARLDVTDSAAVMAALRETKPDVAVNCAAWTAVDDAESHETRATTVNGAGAANVVAACDAVGARLVHISTDYVFDGDSDHPYAEYHQPAPRTAYGRSKLIGEQAVLQRLPHTGYVVRTSWLYGEHGRNFVSTMIRLEAQRGEVSVVADQHGQPTWTKDVARQILLLARSGSEPGIYHATTSGATTWHGLACEVFRLLGADPVRVKAVTTADYPLVAPRPAYTVLGHERWAHAGLPSLPAWTDSLERAFPALLAAGRK